MGIILILFFYPNNVTMGKKLQIGQRALLISFMRVNIGKEFEVARRLSRRLPQKSELQSYYTCYGQYDLIEFQLIDSNDALNNVPFDKDIIDCEISLFYSWEGISQNIKDWAKGFPALVMVLLKIQPPLEEKLTFNVESDVLNYINKIFSPDANLFAGMGRSEILLLLRGTSFENLLPKISALRQQTTIAQVMRNHSKIKCDKNLPIFIDSTTFPLIAHPALQGDKNYNALEGTVLPVVNVMCHPGFEKVVSQKRLPSCSRIFNHYGNYDVTMTWDKPVLLSIFAKELTDFRFESKEGIRSTGTIFLDANLKPDNGTSTVPLLNNASEFDRHIKKIIKKSEKSKKIDPMVRSRLREFYGRFNSYLMQQESKTSFRDMRGITFAINANLDKLNKSSHSQYYSLNNEVSEIIDLCNNALYQRYAGLETHFETCKHLPFPFLRGISGLISAATCVPFYIFKEIFPKNKIYDAWPGFVVFGLSYSYQLLCGRILSYPASSLYKPVEDWWGITHEVAHAIYHASDFYSSLPRDVKKYLEDTALNKPSISIEIEEIYANWFDFRYFFKSDKSFYFPTIWKSWLRWERVWRHKEQYVFRSFVIFTMTNRDKLLEIRNKKGFKYTTESYLRSQYNEMKKLILTKVRDFDDFEKTISRDEIGVIIDIVYRLQPLYDYLQNKHFNEKDYKRVNPSYPISLLRKHIRYLEKGIIVTDNIPNPVELLHELYKKYPGSDTEVPVRTTAAVILTLWFKYMTETVGNKRI